MILIDVDTEPWRVGDNVIATLHQYLNREDLRVVEPELLHR